MIVTFAIGFYKCENYSPLLAPYFSLYDKVNFHLFNNIKHILERTCLFGLTCCHKHHSLNGYQSKEDVHKLPSIHLPKDNS